MASVFLNEVDDFLNPSEQGCVNPLFTNIPASNTNTANTKKRHTSLVIEDAMDQTILSEDTIQKPKAVVSVADCLACSGCVTSAETVLISNTYSLSSLKKEIGQHRCSKVAVTVSMAVLVDLMRYLGLSSLHVTYYCLSEFLRTALGVAFLVNGDDMNSISLCEMSHEFIYRYKMSNGLLQLPVKNENQSAPGPSVALSAEETGDTRTNKSRRHKAGRVEHDYDPTELPMLTSTCPGWVCYVEKAAPYAIPYLSTTKSPMAMSGALLKHGYYNYSTSSLQERQSSCDDDDFLYHIGLMPCHDKKLEASRKDLAWEQVMMNNKNFIDTITTIPDVDLVLTTAELLQLMQEAAAGSNCNDTQYTCLDDYVRYLLKEQEHFCGCSSKTKFFTPTGSFNLSGSGLAADYVFRIASKEIYNVNLAADDPLSWKPKSPRNPDLKEVALYKHDDGTYSCSCGNDNSSSVAVLKFCAAYGFRNVQGILQRMKKSGRMGCDYHFVEVMACPSGCLNGGGQIRHDAPSPSLALQTISNIQDTTQFLTTNEEKKRETPANVRKRIQAGRNVIESNTLVTSPELTKINVSLNEIGLSAFGEKAQELFHTRFHTVPKLELSSGAVAGVAAQDTKW